MLKPNPSYQPHRHLEPFGEPRTMAVQWDLSSMISKAIPAVKTSPSDMQDADPVQVDPLSKPEAESAFEKFPQPSTIPAGWDLSELL
jgi:hypothetical protein